MSDWVKVAAEGDVPDGGALQVELGGEAIALFNVAGRIRAIQNACLHRGGPLAEGELDGDIVTCPLHGWQFDVTTGKCRTSAGSELKTYQVKVEGGDILLSPEPGRPG